MKNKSFILMNRFSLACFIIVSMLLSTASIFAVPANDLCVNAIAVTCGSATPGTNIGATGDSGSGITTCGTAAPGSQPGVWYSFAGNGNYVTLSLCGATSINFDAQLSVWSGTCGLLSCVEGNNNSCGFDPKLSFFAANGTAYFILVSGEFGETGNFTLGVSCAIAPNDECANAIPISCGQTLAGNTAIATSESVPACGPATTAPGVWYAFVGTGQSISVTTCNDGTDYNTRISVYEGSCGSLTCVVNNDNDAGCSFNTSSSTADFNSVNGTTYLIYVHGSGSVFTNNGNFEVTVNCQTETCSGATPFSILSQDVVQDIKTVSGISGFVFDVAIKVNLTHTDYSNLLIQIKAPSGLTKTLSQFSCPGATAFSGIFDDDASSIVCTPVSYGRTRPAVVNALAGFNGETANGNWTILITDFSDDPEGTPVGAVSNWCLEVSAGACGKNSQCNDGNACTSDFCFNGTCTGVTQCDDDNLCTTDACDGLGGCTFTPVNCTDNDVCTIDGCDGLGGCTYTSATCNDNTPCTTDACTPGSCVFSPYVCNDNDNCTTDACNGTGECTFTSVVCNDNDACNGVETCNPATGCVAGTPLNCDDNISCTTDGCNSLTGCTHTPGSISVSISQSAISGNFCQGSEIQLTANSATAISYSWSTGATTQSITASPGTSYSVTASDVSGCTGTANINTTAQSTDSLSAYTIIALNTVTMSKNKVFSGGVGAKNTSTGIVKLNMGSTVTAPNTFVKAKSITLSGGSAATVQILAPSNAPLPVFQTNPNAGTNFSVPSNSIVTLTGSIYGNLTIGKNSTVTFTSPNLYTKDFTTGDNVKLIFAPCTKARVKGKLLVGKINSINQANQNVIFYVTYSAEVRAGTNFQADLYVRDGKLYTPNATLSAPTVMTGLFIAKDVDAKDYTNWYWNPGCIACPASKTSENTVAITSDDDVFMNAYPNPFTDKLNIEFTLAEDSEVKLEAFNLSGQRLAIIFEGNVRAEELHAFEFNSESLASGMIIYRLQTDKGSYYGKAVKTR